VSKGLVVVVEDDAHIRRIYDSGLTELGFTVLTASDGEDGLSLLSQHEPRVVVLDINLPGIDGIEVCRRSRALKSGSAPVIFITANDDLEILHQCVEAGGDDFIVKGGPVRAMLERVAYWARAGATRRMTDRQRTGILTKTGERLEADKAAREAQARAQAKSEQAQSEQAAADAGLMASPEVQAIVEAFHRNSHIWPAMDDRSVRSRLKRFGYITGLVNAAARESLGMKIGFLDYLRAAVVSCGAADAEEARTMFDHWHELYDNPNFAHACALAEQHFADQRRDP
jgi:DNA-binding response OmpR family regulator